MQGNKVILVGYVGQELATKKLKDGGKRVGIRVATHYKHGDEKEDCIYHTVWHDIVAWNQTAEFAERSFVKGSRIMVEGYVEYRTYPDNTGHTGT